MRAVRNPTWIEGSHLSRHLTVSASIIVEARGTSSPQPKFQLLCQFVFVALAREPHDC